MFIKRSQNVRTTSTHNIKNMQFLKEIRYQASDAHDTSETIDEDANDNNAERNRHIHKREALREVIEVENKLL